jgi:hypothetical protein
MLEDPASTIVDETTGGRDRIRGLGRYPHVQLRKVIRRRLRHVGSGVDVASDVNATIAVNVNEATSRKADTTTPGGPHAGAQPEGPSQRR